MRVPGPLDVWTHCVGRASMVDLDGQLFGRFLPRILGSTQRVVHGKRRGVLMTAAATQRWDLATIAEGLAEWTDWLCRS